MTDKRFDNRSKATFKKDIKFGTAMETYFFDKWVQSCDDRDDISIYNCRDNGVGNDGEYVETGTNTSGADYMVDYFDSEYGFTNLPLEVKWVPTAGKLSLKINDLRAYQKENAGILFIYNSVNCGTNLRKPKDYDYNKYIDLIESKSKQFRWGFMPPENISKLINSGDIVNIPYMGNKKGIIVKQKDFHKWFKEEQF